ncbi:MAG: D-aminoacyl-tRNA deacylase [Acidimicrobiales bacterium]|nr:D-aminoacyl-tRNA deacylase [Acidimicrobiales bacterium]
MSHWWLVNSYVGGLEHRKWVPVRALIQRVSRASVSVDRQIVGAIGTGLCVFVGVTHDDDDDKAIKMATKIWNLRIFEDEEKKMNKSLGDINGEVLVVSQFTLYGDTTKGRRPSFVEAASPEVAEPLIAELCKSLEDMGANVATGRFRCHMEVEIHNDGPVTLAVDV